MYWSGLILRKLPALKYSWLRAWVSRLACDTWVIVDVSWDPLHVCNKLMHKKWSFSLRIFSVNVTKSTVSCGHIYWNIFNAKLNFLCSVTAIRSGILSLLAPTPQSGQTHSNTSSAYYRWIVWVCLSSLWGWYLRVKPSLKNWNQNMINNQMQISTGGKSDQVAVW